MESCEYDHAPPGRAGGPWGGTGTYHFCGGLGVVCGHVLLQGHLCVAHPAAVGAGEGLGLLHREGLAPVVQVCREEGGVRGSLTSPGGRGRR